MTVAPVRSERAATLACRIVKRYGDEELSGDLLNLLILVSDPAGDPDRADAAREAMRQIIGNSGMIEEFLDQRCRLVETETNDAVRASLAGLQPSAEAFQAGAEVVSDQQAATR